MRIWFNHWFSTAYRLMELLKQGDSSIEIIASSRTEHAVYQKMAEEFYVEPTEISDADYVDWCIEFCKEHKIDVLFPRRCRVAISENLHRFDEIGVKVLVDRNVELMDLLEDKKKTADLFFKHQICKVPTMFIVNNVKQFKNAYDLLKQKYVDDRICIKYCRDEGATSFRVIDDVVDNISVLRIGNGAKITYEKVCEMLASVEQFDDLIVMPYLKGPEVSIDSLNTNKGFIGISRYKVGTRSTAVEYNETLYNISKKFAEVTGIKCPYNLQLRYHNDELYLLEVNTRMAGGSHKSFMTGINIPYIALCDLVGKDFDLPNVKDIKSLTISEIETPIIL